MNDEIFFFISLELLRTLKHECVGNMQGDPCRPGQTANCTANCKLHRNVWKEKELFLLESRTAG